MKQLAQKSQQNVSDFHEYIGRTQQLYKLGT
jgi:hypothetical protein